MKRCMFTVGPRTRKGMHPVFLKDGGRLIGYLCEHWGKGAGWFYRIASGTDWVGPHSSKTQAVNEMGKKL